MRLVLGLGGDGGQGDLFAPGGNCTNSAGRSSIVTFSDGISSAAMPWFSEVSTAARSVVVPWTTPFR